MKKHEARAGMAVKITYSDEWQSGRNRHEGKVATIISVDGMGDCDLKFGNGKRAFYHATWLEPVEANG